MQAIGQKEKRIVSVHAKVQANLLLKAEAANSEFSPCHLGSEFKDTQTLENLYGHHPYWERMKRILDNSMINKYHNGDLTESTRKGDFEAALA